MSSMIVFLFNQNSRKTRRYAPASVFILSLALFIASVPSDVKAAPFDREFTFSVPEGRSIILHGRGDEFSAIFETIDGYTVVYDVPSRTYQFATRGPDGQLAGSGLTVGMDNPAAAGIARHVRPDRAVEGADRQARKQAREEKTGTRKRWEKLKIQHRAQDAAPRLANVDSAPPSSPTVGNKVGLTLLVDFSDAPATIIKSEIENFLNGNDDSVKTYFYDNSAGRLIYTNVVVGYLRMPNPKAYYDNPDIDNGSAGRLLLRDAINVMKLRPDFDSQIRPLFDDLTVNAYNSVVACNVFYAGSYNSPWGRGLWPSASAIGSTELWPGGKTIFDYQITDIGTVPDMGTFCHENGHMLCGFPDIYDYDHDSIGGAGMFCLMGYGGSRTNVCAYLKYAAGWATNVIDVTTSTQTYSLPMAGGPGGNVMLRFKNPVAPDTEYFLVENRQAFGRDASIPASGMAVWHVDELGDMDDQRTAWNAIHDNYECSLEQADNAYHFQKGQNSGDARDLFYLGNSSPGYANVFNDGSGPSAKWWIGAPSGLSMAAFSASGATMTVTARDQTAIPTIASFSVNNGAAVSYFRDATLHSICTGVANYYQASESPDFAAAQWRPYSPDAAFRIDSTGGGDKTVYFKVKNRYGESNITSDSIVLGLSTPEGAGTEANPYEIRDLSHLVWMSDTVSSSSGKTYLLMNDLDASAGWFANFKPIGNDARNFKGTFNGAGGKIRGLTINRPGEDCIGLFGIVGTSGRVKNLMIEGGTVTGNYDVGAVAGSNTGIVENCCAICSVKAWSDRGGGLVGSNAGTIQNCWARGSVTGGGSVGGIVGANFLNKILYCYAAGPISGVTRGGLAGIGYGTIQYSYWDKNATGLSTSAGSASTFGKTTAEMKIESTFANWDFISIWSIKDGVNGGYPHLRLFIDTPAVLTLQINGGAVSTANRAVTLNNDSALAPRYYMASESPAFEGAAWKAYAAMPNFTIDSAGNGAKTVYFKVKNAVGESLVTSDSIALDETAVTSFAINHGEESTVSREVTLNNTCAGHPTFYMASESATFAGAQWIAYSGSPSFSITSAGNGSKTIYFKLKNASGDSSPVSDTILLNEPIRIISLSGALDFGDTVVGSVSQRTMTITNSLESNSALQAGSFNYPTGFSGNWSSGSIQPGSSIDVLVTFAPAEFRDYGGTVTLSANQTAGSTSMHVSGRGVGIVGSVNRASCQIIHNALMAGQTLYTDRDYVFKDPIPPILYKKTYIRTPQSVKDITTSNYLTITLNQTATIYVGLDQRITTPPSWLASWTKHQSTLVTSDSGSPGRNLYYKTFDKGPVILGPNRETGMPTGRSMYSVIVTPVFAGIEAWHLNNYE